MLSGTTRLHAGHLTRRMSPADRPSGGLLVGGGVAMAISQICWWGTVIIGFLNTLR